MASFQGLTNWDFSKVMKWRVMKRHPDFYYFFSVVLILSLAVGNYFYFVFYLLLCSCSQMQKKLSTKKSVEALFLGIEIERVKRDNGVGVSTQC